MELTICTFNIRNFYLCNRDERDDYFYVLKNFIIDNDIDVMGMQEVTRRIEREIRKGFSDYFLFGKYRYGKLPSLRGTNEGVFILSRDMGTDTYSRYLIGASFLYGSIVPRVMVSCYIRGILFINVHLEYMSMKAKWVCLERLFCYIDENRDRDIVLMGDFNMTLRNGYFREFVIRLKNIGIGLVNNTVNTYIGDKGEKILDYVFVSRGINVTRCYTDSGICISDHIPFIVKISL